MKTVPKVLTFILVLSLLSIGTFFSLKKLKENKETEQEIYEEPEVLASAVEEVVEDPIVYDGLTLTELSDKLNRSLNSTISGYGELFASYSLEKGVDPYLVVAIVLHETGCKWSCSTLVTACNNVGGQKGRPSCGGGSYMSYATLEDGIKGMIDNLYAGYISKGLTTPETIGPKYAASTSWAEKINSYIRSIKAS